jgi:hypothetical protein
LPKGRLATYSWVCCILLFVSKRCKQVTAGRGIALPGSGEVPGCSDIGAAQAAACSLPTEVPQARVLCVRQDPSRLSLEIGSLRDSRELHPRPSTLLLVRSLGRLERVWETMAQGLARRAWPCPAFTTSAIPAIRRRSPVHRTCCCATAGMPSGLRPPEGYNHREQLLETTLQVVSQEFPELTDLVLKGNLQTIGSSAKGSLAPAES